MTRFSWLFAASGAAGLIYEVTWTRYLATFLGHGAFAQALVLFAFLGGMAIGALLVADRSEAPADPLRAYAVVEALLGLSALTFQPLYQWATDATYAALLPTLPPGMAVTAVRWGIGVALILPPSLLMGMTVPLMSSAVIRRLGEQDGGQAIARLYGANSLGAAIGVLLAGFVLIARFGLHATLLVGGGLNAGIAALAWYQAARDHRTGLSVSPSATIRQGQAPFYGPAVPLRTLWGILLLVSAGTAIASYLYEIAWVRMLSLVLGSATHAFELMLSAFILGLAGGAYRVRHRLRDHPDPLGLLARVQLVMGGSALATLLSYPLLFPAMAWVMAEMPKTDGGYAGFTVLRYGLALLLMLPTTWCAGMTFPLLTTVLLRHGAGSRAIGIVSGVNSIGAIFGVAAGALWLMPVVGLRGLLQVGALVDIGLGLLLLWGVPWWMGRRTAERSPSAVRVAMAWRPGVLALLTIGVALAWRPFDPVLLASGVFRTGSLPEPGESVVLSHVDGRTATVSVERSWDGTLSISTNGKVDASIEHHVFLPPAAGGAATRPGLTGDASTQVLLSLVTLAHRPEAQRIAVIGHGSGQSGHLLLGGAAVRDLTTVEIEPEMLHASRFARPVNRRVFADPRSRFVIDDARAFFAGEPTRYDLIMSEPSNPSVSGVAGLFTVEFYRRIRDALEVHGVFGQWLPLYEGNDAMFLSVLAAIHRVFPDYRVYLVDHADVLIVASPGRLRTMPDWSVAASDQVRQDLRWYRPVVREHLEAGLLLDRPVLQPLLEATGSGAVVPNTDDVPLLDLAAERARFLDRPSGVEAMAEDRFDLPAALRGWIRPLGQALDPTTGVTRSSALALGARLRHADGLADTRDRSAVPEPMARLEAFRQALQSRTPPAAWGDWVRQAMEFEHALHGGTAGVADSAFHAALADYAEWTGAPPSIRALLRFRFAMARHDWPAAAAEIEPVVPLMAGTRPPMPATTFRLAAVVALFRTGQLDRAEALLASRQLGAITVRDSLAVRLLGAHLAKARRDGRSAP